WGVRASTPTPQDENLRYGGNTSCVEVRLGNALYIVDGGTGLRSLGHQLLHESNSRQPFVYLFVSHFHCDQMHVISFFPPSLNHPQGCLGFRLATKQGVVVYATDNEPGDAIFDKNVRKLAEGADVLIYDAQYLPEEYEARKRGWGHSHWREAVNIVMESGAKE